jgi:hypothetical protein
MNLKHLEIHNFRCFTNFELAVGGESLTIVAPNAGGKSTLLTAVTWALSGARGISRDDLADPAQQLVIIATVGGLRSADHGVFVEGALRFEGSPTVRIGVRGTWDEDAEQLDVDWGFPDAGWPAEMCVPHCLSSSCQPTGIRDASRSSQAAAASSPP